MNVKELREELAKFPDDMRVVVNGHHGGCKDLDNSQISIKDMILNYHDEFDQDVGGYGSHELYEERDEYYYEDESKYAPIKALLLSRNREEE